MDMNLRNLQDIYEFKRTEIVKRIYQTKIVKEVISEPKVYDVPDDREANDIV